MQEQPELPKEYCGKWTWKNLETGETAQAHCGCISCPRKRCKESFWCRRVGLISELIQEYELKKFFTLTLDRAILTEDVKPWDYIHKPWCSFRRVIKRKFEAFKFVAVLESHKDERWPHIHGFTNIWMDQADWSKHWSACGGGGVVWVERVKDEKASEYVGKQIKAAQYVGKQQFIDAYKHRGNRRIFWRSTALKAASEIDGAPSPWVLKFKEWNHGSTIATSRAFGRSACRQKVLEGAGSTCGDRHDIDADKAESK